MTSKFFFPRLARRRNYRLTNRDGYYADYHEYREEIREDCQNRCYYCDSHENEVGGTEHMQLDHFRPKSLPEYLNIVNDPNNLVYACAGCNRFKSDDWPAQGLVGTINGNAGYIDRFDRSSGDLHKYIRIEENGVIVAIQIPAGHMITQLALNRYTRIRLRELRLKRSAVLIRLDEIITGLQNELESNGEEFTVRGRSLIENHLNDLSKFRENLADTYGY